jgi:hypothetical protein
VAAEKKSVNSRTPFTLFWLIACGGISPMRGHAVVGRDAYLVFVGDGPGGQADLFGVRADGGPVFQITYSAVPEAAPALSPDGGVVAFLRGSSTADPRPGKIWVLNLLSGAEREVQLPRGAGQPTALGWSKDGRGLYVRADTMVFGLVAPPASGEGQVVAGAERAEADSSFAVLLGQPAFGQVVPCATDLCVQTPNGGAPTPFASNAHDAVRWGTDSVGYVSGPDLIVRPVGPGRPRRVEWSGAPARIRGLTFFSGNSVNSER